MGLWFRLSLFCLFLLPLDSRASSTQQTDGKAAASESSQLDIAEDSAFTALPNPRPQWFSLVPSEEALVASFRRPSSTEGGVLERMGLGFGYGWFEGFPSTLATGFLSGLESAATTETVSGLLSQGASAAKLSFSSQEDGWGINWADPFPGEMWPDPSRFRHAEWVEREDLERFEKYARRRASHDEYYDYGKLRGRDLEYVYRIYLKGSTAEQLDTSNTWRTNILGTFIEQMDGVSAMILAIEKSFFEFNLFKPINPFRTFGQKLDSGPDLFPKRQEYRPSGGLGPSWKWRGDLTLGVGSFSGGLDVEEVVLKIGQLKLSDDFIIKFDLFYFDAGEFRRTGIEEDAMLPYDFPRY